MPLCVCMTTANWPVNVSTTRQVQTVGNARRIIRADLGAQARICPSPKALQIPVSPVFPVLVRMSATTSSSTARTEGRVTTTCVACARPLTRASCARSCDARRPAAAAPTPARARPRTAARRCCCCCWPLCWWQPAPWCSRRRAQPPDGPVQWGSKHNPSICY